jgi:hypothetical protein
VLIGIVGCVHSGTIPEPRARSPPCMRSPCRGCGTGRAWLDVVCRSFCFRLRIQPVSATHYKLTASAGGTLTYHITVHSTNNLSCGRAIQGGRAHKRAIRSGNAICYCHRINATD